MVNMKELEKRWYYYKAIKSLRSINSFAFIGMLSLGSYYTYTQVDTIKNLFNKDVLIAKKSIEQTEAIAEAKEISKEYIESNQVSNVVLASKNEGFSKSEQYEVSLEPVIPIIDMEKVSHKTSSKRAHKAPTHTNTTKSNMVKAKAATYLTASELSTIKQESKHTHKVTLRNTEKIKKINLHGSSVNYIENMKHKFSMSKNHREALLLAKAFYEKHDYSKSEKWALTANKLDSSKDESWHLFAKSKAKLGHKNEALRILSSYYKKSHSSKTKALMLKIQSNRL